ncbi:glycosyltransferase [Caulobacter hibisci]|uniref:Glycosyltransferase n=1 Tax=Caulobacter hibisci TaxID=2035993 RepID=A0ABS0T5P0_9CAUL|nr:glycosyltransferase [Caulobacter hibisci]
MKPKILFVINSLAGGGAERVLTTLIAGSQRFADRYAIVVVLLDREEEVYDLPDWVETVRLDGRQSLARSFLQIWGLIGRMRPALTVSFLTRANVVTAMAMALRGRPFVLSERVNTTAHLNEGRAAALAKLLVRLTYPRADRIVAVSQGVADTLAEDFGVAPAAMVAIANPVPAEKIAARATETPTMTVEGPYVVAMGRLVPNKNFALSIEAFARSEAPGRLLILGEGPERPRLEALVERLGVSGRVLMPGFAANPYALIARAEFMALSSNAEGFPNALVEALACGVPVVATDCASGPAEVLEATVEPKPGAIAEGQGGLLIPVNDVEAMAAAFRRMQDPALRARLRAAGGRRVLDFTVARAVERYWAVIEDTLRAR